ncbi:MAG: hypothetical protein MR266_00015 [Erysipelotrichaceae bacterium]|mgnify:CR=1 FL=1|nr:hypothetical protein [Erysipelotrichaceae bacterium]
MQDFIISNYISKLDKNNITYFALKNDIRLNDNELDYVYKTIKNDYKILLSNNYESVFNESRNKLSSENYDKLYKLYLVYRKMYEGFLN